MYKDISGGEARKPPSEYGHAVNRRAADSIGMLTIEFGFHAFLSVVPTHVKAIYHRLYFRNEIVTENVVKISLWVPPVFSVRS